MKINPIYKHEIISLPAEAVSEKLSTATADELRVLIAVFRHPEFELSALATELDMTENATRRAISAWADCGVLEIKDGMRSGKQAKASANAAKNDPAKTSEEQKEGLIQSSVLPHYTSLEVASVVERTEGCSELLDSCQQVLGKIFNAAETAIILGMRDHLSLSNEYILLLCSHAAHMQKPSIRYVEKMAIDLFDRDIITYSDLENELNAVEYRRTMEYYIRNLFGLGKRALIKKEKEFMAAWIDKYKFSKEMINAAYEVTVSKTKDPTLNYANAVLENWFAAGYKTVEEVKAAEEERAKNKDVPAGTSFSTDSFFEAALKRSYGE